MVVGHHLASASCGVWLGDFLAHWGVVLIVVRLLLLSLFSLLPSSFRPMSLSILPTSTELATLGTLTEVVRWVGINGLGSGI